MSILSQLRECSFRGISFPIVSIIDTFHQDLAIHKKLDVNGARIEPTGRQPTVYQVRAVFYEHVMPGVNESWGRQALFPTVFQDVKTACETGGPGWLVHPFYGSVRVCPQSWSASLLAERQDGMMADITFIENTLDDAAEPKSSVTQVASLSAAQLDIYVPPIMWPVVEKRKTSFTDLCNTITSAFDSVSLLEQRTSGKIDLMVGAVNRVQNSIESFAGTTKAIVSTNCSRLKNAGLALKKVQLTLANKTISNYIVKQNVTIANLANILKNSVEDLITLNPDLARFSTVPVLTYVRYYKAII